MLTFQTLKLLKKLKKYENPVVINYDKKHKYCYVTENENLTCYADNKFDITYIGERFKDDTLVFQVPFDEMYYLDHEDYIFINERKVIISHTAFHWKQFTVIKFLDFCYKSVFVPIIVSVLTYFVIHFLESRLLTLLWHR